MFLLSIMKQAIKFLLDYLWVTRPQIRTRRLGHYESLAISLGFSPTSSYNLNEPFSINLCSTLPHLRTACPASSESGWQLQPTSSQSPLCPQKSCQSSCLAIDHTALYYSSYSNMSSHSVRMSHNRLLTVFSSPCSPKWKTSG